MFTNITPKISNKKLYLILCFICVALVGISQTTAQSFTTYRGKVVNNNGTALSFVNLTVENTTTTTITNADGEFVLKVSNQHTSQRLIVSYLGYKTAYLNFSEFSYERQLIQLEEVSTTLNEIILGTQGTAKSIVKEALKRKENNYLNDQSLMTAFYRETIKKRRRNVSLAEAVVTINKQPYTSYRADKVALYKARKSTDYTKIDTIALKLQGGPLNALYADIMKYPEYFLTDVEFENYTYTFSKPTEIEGRQTYVIDFKQRDDIAGPLFYGKLYIDTQTLALTDAIFSINVENKEDASALFVRKKPKEAFVYPTKANYRVNYRTKQGKWYYGYSSIQLEFVIDWNNRLFNSKYSLHSEMAITNLETYSPNTVIKNKDKYRFSKILVDETRGFSDSEFWGEYNVIEPDKSIESAIKKIKRKLGKR